MKEPITYSDYRQYLLVSQINHTLTNFAEHSEHFSHDRLNRYLGNIKLTARSTWKNTKAHLVLSKKLFGNSHRSEAVPRLWPRKARWGRK